MSSAADRMTMSCRLPPLILLTPRACVNFRRALAVTLLALAVHEAWMAHAPLGLIVCLRGVVGVIISLVYCNSMGLPVYNAKHQVSVPPQRPSCTVSPSGVRWAPLPLQQRTSRLVVPACNIPLAMSSTQPPTTVTGG